MQKLKKDVETELQDSFRRFKASPSFQEHLCSVVIHHSLSEIGLVQTQHFHNNVDDIVSENVLMNVNNNDGGGNEEVQRPVT